MLKLLTRRVEKPWGRDVLPQSFAEARGRRIGEIWYQDPARPDLPLLPKFLFTNENLSIQVHPSGLSGAEHREPGDRAECWYIVEAEDGARVGYGFTRPTNTEELRTRALNGSIQDLVAWHPVKAGDFIFVPSGAVHAIGAGLTILEFQQSADVTYRLFDYGRGRAVQLEEALAAASLDVADSTNIIRQSTAEDSVLASTTQFTIAKVASPVAATWMGDRQRWVMPLSGGIASGGVEGRLGDCLLLEPGEPLSLQPGTTALMAAVGPFDSPGI